MALTEIQLPTKDELYQNLRTLANEIRRSMERWEAASDFLNDLTTTDLDAMSIPDTGTVRADMVALRVMLQEMVSYFGNNSVTPTNDPKEVVDVIRQMLVI